MHNTSLPNIAQPIEEVPVPTLDLRPQNAAGRDVPAGFPRIMLPLLRCVVDAGELEVGCEKAGSADGILDGHLRCVVCAREYPVENGIVRLLGPAHTLETEHEIHLKDEEYEAMPDHFVPPETGWRSVFMDHIEIPPHLSALGPVDRLRVLEIGSGDGRFTALMAQMGAHVLAVDFSFWALRKAQRHLARGEAPTAWRLPAPRRSGNLTAFTGLVQADASQLQLAPRSFHRALSATPLDSRDERMKMYSVISESLTDDGRYIAGVEFDDLQRWLLGLSLVRRYSPGGILIEHLDRPTLRRELAPFFGHIRMRPIRVRVPMGKRLPLKLRVAVARLASALPVLRNLGEILLASASRPRRLPQDGVRRSGHFGAKNLYRRYKQWRGEDTTWSLGDGPV